MFSSVTINSKKVKLPTNSSLIILAKYTNVCPSIVKLGLKLNTKITLNHHPPPPTTNFLKGSRLHRRLRFDMQAFLGIRNYPPPP